ncbi:MAG TPA: DUF433 domain-containing protein [Caulobacteraceae bacterium]|jgi:uncharacterized protein (DUF433 family)|nr:DUF433 domain-containing protein [Caulobacteraceae bacterium]
MEHASTVIGAFSEEHAAQLSGVSRRQLRQWDKKGLLHPSYGAEDSGLPYGRTYSFRDLVSLRALGQLRNQYHVAEAHLIEVQKELSVLSDEPWASRTLEVLNRRVVVYDSASRHKREVVGGQHVFNIPLKVVITGVRSDVAKMNERSGDQVGKVVQAKFVSQNQPVLSGTRIPVAAIQSFARAGYNTDRILKEYPGLTAADVQAALAYESDSAAA